MEVSVLELAATWERERSYRPRFSQSRMGSQPVRRLLLESEVLWEMEMGSE